MKNIKFYLIAASGWAAFVCAIYWGFNHCDDKNQVLVKKLNSVITTKQNPTGTFVDEAGREHVQFRDGSTAKIPTTPAQQKAYTNLRDTLLGPAIKYLLAKDDVITNVSKITTKTVSTIAQSSIDTLKNSIQTDKWTKLIRTPDGYKIETITDLGSVRFTRYSGLFNLKKTPMISFFNENPNAKVMGYERWDQPLPLYQPILRLYMQGEYDFVLNNAATDINASFRIGKFEFGGFGRLSLNLNETDIQSRNVRPSYGAKVVYNIKQY